MTEPTQDSSNKLPENLCHHLVSVSECCLCAHESLGLKSKIAYTGRRELEVGDTVFVVLKIKSILIDAKGKHYELRSDGWGTVQVDESSISR